MSNKLNNAKIIACAAILGFASSAVSAQSTDKPLNNAADTYGAVAWKIFPGNDASGLLPTAAPQPAAGAETSGLTALLSADAASTATPNAVTTNIPGPAKTPAAAPAASPANVSLPSSTQDLIMDINRHPSGINHAGKSAQSIGTVSVPLPTAAWTGLTALLGLGAIAYGKKIVRLIAQ